MGKKRVSGIIFDWDDTLVDSLNPSYEGHRIAAKYLKLRKFSFSKFRRVWGEPWSKIISSLWPNIEIGIFKKFFKKMVNINFPITQEAKNVINILHKKGIKLAVVTSRDRDLLPWQDPIIKLFDIIVTPQDVPYTKPNPKVFEPVLNNWKGIEKENIFYVGDLVIDYLAAKNAGINFIALINKHNKRDFVKTGISKEDMINSLDQLVDKLI